MIFLGITLDPDDHRTREQRIDAAEDRAEQAAFDVARERSFDCPRCDGRGEVWTGRNEYDTGQPITVECPACTPLGGQA